jgi:hypothetical protein
MLQREKGIQSRPEMKPNRRAWRHWDSKAKSNNGNIDLESSGMGAPTLPVKMVINEDDYPSLNGIQDDWPDALVRGLNVLSPSTEKQLPKNGVIFDA